MDFDPIIEAQISGRVAYADVLVEFWFDSGIVRVWNGFGSLKTNDDRLWLGTASHASVEGISQAVNGAAPTQTFTLSGVDSSFASLVTADQEEYYRLPVRTFMQFFDMDWQCIGSPIALDMRQMDVVTLSRSEDEDGWTYAITITAETAFITRSRPPNGYWTDRDQQTRFPDDLGLVRMAGIDGRIIRFPTFN